MIDEKKLIELIFDLKEQYIRDYEKFGNSKEDFGGIQTCKHIIEIVNQLAEEHNLTPCYLGSPCEYQNEDAKMPPQLLDFIQFVDDNNRWIPCSERLPEVGVPVLVCNAQGKVYIRMINWISSGRTQIPYWSQQSTGIIAWRELPAPYMPKGE